LGFCWFGWVERELLIDDGFLIYLIGDLAEVDLILVQVEFVDFGCNGISSLI
jgi:hypothetical protein